MTTKNNEFRIGELSQKSGRGVSHSANAEVREARDGQTNKGRRINMSNEKLQELVELARKEPLPKIVATPVLESAEKA